MMKCLNIWLLFCGIWMPINVEAVVISGFSLSEVTDTTVMFDYSTNIGWYYKYKVRLDCRRSYDNKDLKIAEQNADRSGSISAVKLATNTQYKCQIKLLYNNHEQDKKEMSIKTKEGVCKYALGMENGAITNDQITPLHLSKKSLTRPFTSSMYCDARGGFLEIDLGRTMTITGLALKSDRTDREIDMFYKLHPEETYVQVRGEKNNDDLTLIYTSVFSRAWLDTRSLTLRYIKFVPHRFSWKLCLQVELYGCAEVCSSPLRESQLIAASSGTATSSRQLCYTERVLRFDFGRRVTISGVLINSTTKNAQVNVKFRYGQISQGHKQLSNSLNKTYTAVYKLSDITFWFFEDIITRYIEIELISRGICIKASFLGCPTDTMSKLGIESGDRGVVLTASSSHFNSRQSTPNPLFLPERGTLNSMKGAWVPRTKEVGEWLQACLLKVHIVSGIAIQGQGYGFFQYITSYTLKYGYHANASIYMYKTDSTKEYTFPGSSGRYVTIVNKFPVPLMARCLRILPKTFHGHKFAARIELLGGGTQTYGPLMKVKTRGNFYKTDEVTARAFVYAQPGVVIKWSSLNDASVNFTVVEKVIPRGGVNATYESTLTVSKHIDYPKSPCKFTGPINVTCYRRFRVEALYPPTLGSHSVRRNIAINISGLIASVDTDHKLTKTNISMLFTCTPKYQSDFVATYRVAFTNLTSGNTQMFTTTKPVLKFSLRPFTHYHFVLWASNRMIAEGLLVNTSFISDEGFASKVKDFVATVVSKDEIKVQWKHPKVANGIVTNYIIQWRKEGSIPNNTNIQQIRNGATSFVKLFQKLKNYQPYFFRIQPFTNKGKNAGPWTEWISKRTLEGSPSIISGFNVIVQSKDEIVVNWKKPLQKNGVLTSYSLEVKTAGSKVGAHTIRDEFERPSFTKVFEKLQNYQRYAFRIRAFTNKDKNAGPWTQWIEKRTFEGIPSAVEDFVVTVLSKDEIKVAWKHPKVANGVVTNYTIQWKKDGSNSININISRKRNGPTSFVKFFQKLQNYQLYSFKIRAFTNKGKNGGPWTKWVDKRTFEGIPGKPRAFGVTVKSVNSVSISWRAPQSRNGIIRSYTLKFSGLKPYNNSFQHLGRFVLNDTSKSLDNLFPGSEYTFILHATTITNGPRDVKNLSMPYSAPHAPNLRLEENVLDTKKIIMNTVSSLTGPISHYELSFTENKCSQHHTRTIMLPMQHPNMGVITVVKGERLLSHSHMPIFHNISLPLIGNYHVCYRAVINTTNKVVTGKYSSLILNRSDLARINRSSIEVKEENISFELSPGPLKTKFYQVIVVRDRPPYSLPLNLSDYKSSREGQFPYIAAQLDSQDFNAMKNFIVGDGKVYSSSQREHRSLDEGFENGKLRPGTSYSIMQRAVVDQNTFYSSPWLLGVKTRNAPSPSTKVTDKVRVDEIKGGGGGGAIGAAIGATIVIVAVIALAVHFIRRRQQEMVEKKPVAFTNSEEPLVEMGCVNPATEASDYTTIVYDNRNHSSVAKTGGMKWNVNKPEILTILLGMDEKEKEEEEVTPLLKNPKTLLCHPKHPSMSKQDFMRRWNELTKDNHLKLVTEYESLNSGQQFSWTESIQSEVKIMNRYANIVAYDHSRVHLGNSPIIKDNYINASFIHGYEAPKVYIASQGPNKASSNSFWQMVWEKEIPVIVMVTNLIERGKSKCEQYWEDKGTKTFGNFEVTLSMTDTLSDHIVRKFTLKQTGGKENRTVMHFQFVGWPDHGTPEFPLDVVNFRQRVRKMFPCETTNKPVLVHCSAGVGRTGTFICIDAMLQLARSKQKLDVFNYVNYMRAQRIHMIQTEEQYLFVYQALYELFVCGETECIASEFRRTLDALTSQRTGNGEDGFHDQFKKLRLVTYIPSKDETTEGSRPENIDKNRISSILPSNEKRVLLMGYEGGGSDYINAVYVNGYKKRDEFIATQYPLSNTLDAFWTMVYQSKIGTIVLLLDSQEDDDLIQLYGKVNEKQTHSQCTIFLKNQNHDGIITISKVHVGDNQNNSKNDFDCHVLRMHWPSNGVPSNANDVITMITKMEKHQCKSDSKHILVVCRDGASQCGTLLACTLVLQHLQLEQSVDVLQSVRKVRNSRHQFIPNVEHFQLCYRVVSNYIDSFNTYSNYTE